MFHQPFYLPAIGSTVRCAASSNSDCSTISTSHHGKHQRYRCSPVLDDPPPSSPIIGGGSRRNLMATTPPSMMIPMFPSPLFFTSPSSSPSPAVISSSIGSAGSQKQSMSYGRWDGWMGRNRSNEEVQDEDNRSLMFNTTGRTNTKDYYRRNLINDFDDDNKVDDENDDDDISLDSLDEIIEFFPSVDDDDGDDDDSDTVDNTTIPSVDDVMDNDEHEIPLELHSSPISPLHVTPRRHPSSFNLFQQHRSVDEEHVVMTTTTTSTTTTRTTTTTTHSKARMSAASITASCGRAASAIVNRVSIGPSSKSSSSSSSSSSNEARTRKEPLSGTNSTTTRRPFVYPQFLSPASRRNIAEGGKNVAPDTTNRDNGSSRHRVKHVSTSMVKRQTNKTCVPPPSNDGIHQQEPAWIDRPDRMFRTFHSTSIVPSYGHRNNGRQIVPFNESSQHGSIVVTTVPDHPCPCCAAKQKELDRVEDDLQHMKNMVKKLLGIVSDMARSGVGTQSHPNNYAVEGASTPELMPPPVEVVRPKMITHCISTEEDVPVRSTEHVDRKDDGPTFNGVSLGAFVEKNSPKNRSNDDTASVGSTVSTKSTSSTNSSSVTTSSSIPRKITSLPLTTVNERCPRSKNQRIRVNGQWGTYNGPTLRQKNHKACVLQGCVVRMETGELYVGSLHRNDTGSCTFHPPGTLYGVDGAPKRRIR